MLYPTVKFDSLIPHFGAMRRDLERAFDEVEANGLRRGKSMCPLSMWHDDSRVYIEADVAGFAESDLDLQFDDGKLWIRGERKLADDHPTFEHNERFYGRFERAVTLSDVVDPDSIDAELAHGVLRITLSKKPEAQPRMISIRNGSSSVKKLSGESSAD